MKLEHCTPGREVTLHGTGLAAHPLLGAHAVICQAYPPGNYEEPDTLACPFSFPLGAVLVVLDSSVPWRCRQITVGPGDIRPAPVLVTR